MPRESRTGPLIQPPRSRRRGITVLVVLAIVSIALAMSYAIMRSQTSGLQLQQNTNRGNLARQAALAGLSAGLRAMRQSSWTGVGSTLSGSTSATDSYAVTFTVGDPALTSASPDYGKYPYRVTLTSQGTSVDAAHAGVSTTYKARAVVELVPKQLSPEPSNWSTILGYTLYQVTNDSVSLALPCHVDGPVRLQGGIDIFSPYHWNPTPQSRYFSDLNLMRTGVNEVQTLTRYNATGGTFRITFKSATTSAINYNASATTVQSALQSLSTIGAGNVSVTSGGSGVWIVTFVGQLGLQDIQGLVVDSSGLTGFGAVILPQVTMPGGTALGDYRQFSGPISMPSNVTDGNNRNLLSTLLGVSLINISASYSGLTLSSATSYRLYPGGPTYGFGQLPANASNVTLSPDPVSNPLGVFYASSSVTLGNNVNITGTVVTGADLNISGANVRISPFQLPPLSGGTLPIRIPSVVTVNNFHVTSAASVAVTGTVYVGHQFLVDQGTESTTVNITGNVIVNDDFSISTRNEWNAYSSGQWDTYYALFTAQLSSAGATPYFPKWLSTNASRNYVPLLTLKGDSTPVSPHWQDWSAPIYAIPTGAAGLQWDLVSWEDRI